MKVTDEPIVITQLFNTSREIVWNAITKHDQMIQWFFTQIPDFKAEVGFKTQFNVEAPTRDFYHLWEITKVIPFQKIVFNWKYKNVEGDSFVKFNLIEKGHSTLLVLTSEIIEDFDDAIPEFRRESCEAGWSYFIQEELLNFINTNND